MNADRDRSEQPHAHEWVHFQNVTTSGYALPASELCACGEAREGERAPQRPSPGPGAPDATTDTPDPQEGAEERRKRYAAAIWGEGSRSILRSSAVMAMADAEIEKATADLRAEVERLQHLTLDVANGDGFTTQLGGALIVKCDTYGQTDLHHRLAATEEAWGHAERALAVERARAARVEELACKWEDDADGYEGDGYRIEARVTKADARDLRAALAEPEAIEEGK